MRVKQRQLEQQSVFNSNTDWNRRGFNPKLLQQNVAKLGKENKVLTRLKSLRRKINEKKHTQQKHEEGIQGVRH